MTPEWMHNIPRRLASYVACAVLLKLNFIVLRRNDGRQTMQLPLPQSANADRAVSIQGSMFKAVSWLSFFKRNSLML